MQAGASVPRQCPIIFRLSFFRTKSPGVNEKLEETYDQILANHDLSRVELLGPEGPTQIVKRPEFQYLSHLRRSLSFMATSAHALTDVAIDCRPFGPDATSVCWTAFACAP